MRLDLDATLTAADARPIDADLARRFVSELKFVLQEAGGPGLKALVLGRSVAADEARRQAQLDLATLLHVLPLRPPTLRDLQLEERGHVALEAEEAGADDAVDADAVVGGDQRPDYWRGWQRLHGWAVEPEPEGLTHERLEDLSGEPLLLHLLIVSGYLTPERWKEAADNRNRIYEAIFDKVYARDRRAGKWAVEGIERDEFFTLMECLGLATWANGGRTGSDEEFANLRAIHAAGEREEKLHRLPQAQLKSVAVQFYTRKDLGSPGFEFIHKSFGEYLIARALVATAQRVADESRRRRKEDVAKAWLEIAGLAELTSQIVQFLRDEARLMVLDEAKAVQARLSALMSWGLQEGLPAHLVLGGAPYRQVEACQRYGEGALLATLNACARRTAEEVPTEPALALDWPDQFALKRLLERLRVGRQTFPLESVFDFLCSRRKNNEDKGEPRAIFHYLESSDFYNVSLVHVDLRAATLADADLRNSNMQYADLRDAQLNGAKLGGANLRGANLGGAHLSGANLRDADLGGANLRHARYLRQQQIDEASGDNTTQLPEDLSPPAQWGG